jgi:uncharacterized protein GlcG (DUF336 family)
MHPHTYVKMVVSGTLQHANVMTDTIASLRNRLAFLKAYSAVVASTGIGFLRTLDKIHFYTYVKMVFSSILQYANATVDTIACLRNRLAFLKAYSAVVVDHILQIL